jgi:hypothetical protein
MMVRKHWWVEKPDLTADARRVMNRGDVFVWDDPPHRCFHITLGRDNEWTSLLYPWGETAREALRQRSWIMHNNQSGAEFKKAMDGKEKLFAEGEKNERQLLEDIGKSIAKWGYRDHDYYVMGGGKE